MKIEKATERVDFYKQLVDQLVGFVPDAAVVATVVEQVGKDLRMGQILRREANASNGSNGWNGSNEQPATAKQIGFLRRLGVKDRIERGSQCRCRPNRTLVDSQVSHSIQ